MTAVMAVNQTSGLNYDKRSLGANNRIFNVVENNNNNKSKLCIDKNVRELFSLKSCNGYNRNYNIWITTAIFIILLVPVYGDINSRTNNGMLIIN